MSWRIVDGPESRFQLEWVERGGPPPSTDGPRGFGSTLVTTVAGAEFACKPELDLDPQGVRYRIDAPLAAIMAHMNQS